MRRSPHPSHQVPGSMQRTIRTDSSGKRLGVGTVATNSNSITTELTAPPAVSMQQGPTYRGCNPHTGFPVKSSETQNRPRAIESGPTPKRGSDVLWQTHTGFPVNGIRLCIYRSAPSRSGPQIPPLAYQRNCPNRAYAIHSCPVCSSVPTERRNTHHSREGRDSLAESR